MSSTEALHEILNKVTSACTTPDITIKERNQAVDEALGSELTQNYPVLTNLLLAIKSNRNPEIISQISRELLNVVSDEYSLLHNHQLQAEHLSSQIPEEIKETFCFFDKDKITDHQMNVIKRFNEQAKELLRVLAELKENNPK